MWRCGNGVLGCKIESTAIEPGGGDKPVARRADAQQSAVLDHCTSLRQAGDRNAQELTRHRRSSLVQPTAKNRAPCATSRWKAVESIGVASLALSAFADHIGGSTPVPGLSMVTIILFASMWPREPTGAGGFLR